MSRIFSKKIKLHQGFTLVELIVAISIFAILCSIAIPAYSSWLPEQNLKSAVRELYSTMQLAKMMSIKQNDHYKVEFDTNGQGYSLVRPDGTIDRKIDFSYYDRNGGIRYGAGKATKKAGTSSGPLPVDGVSYNPKQVSFTPRGTGSMGYAYIANRKGTAYAVGTWVSGIIVVKKWNEAKGEWQ